MEAQPFAMVRAALLSVDEAARMVAGGELDDPVAAMAITLAAGSRVVESMADKPRARTTVSRYLARMGGRATPYGVFAGTAAAEMDDDRCLVLGDRSGHRVRVRVDVDALDRAVREAVDEVGPERWPLRVNPNLRVEGPTLRYARSGDASADVVTVRSTAIIEELLGFLGRGTLLGGELIDRLRTNRAATSRDVLGSFLERLVDTGVLQQAVDLIAPGAEPAELALDLLRRIGDADRTDALQTLVDEVCGDHPLGTALPTALSAAWELAAKRVAAFAGIDEAHRFHLELALDMQHSTLDRRTIDDLEQAMLRLRPLSPVGGELEELRDAFRARYEDAEVPLLATLDLEAGVRPSPSRGRSQLAGSAGVSRDDPDDSVQIHPARLRILDQWLRHGGPVDISDLPQAQHSGVRSVQTALLDNYEGRYRSMLVGGLGRSPFALLARFCVGRDELERRIAAWTEAEDEQAGDPAERPIHAELVYNPGGRIANVLIRPRITEDTLALTGAAGGTLGLDRLLVRLDGDELRLRDAVSGRPVVIELNTAHNVDMHGQDPVYSVLGHLAALSGVGWKWCGLRSLAHLPRVTCGSVIVAPERWRLDPEDVRSALQAPDPPARLRALLDGVGGRRWVGTGPHDHVLPIDLTSTRSVTTALSRSASNDEVEIVEMPQLESPAAAGPTGGHVAEAIVPLRAPRQPQPRTPAAPFDPSHGTSWVYFKYYTGHATADVVAARARRLTRTLHEDGIVRGWFYLRYQDDGHHVRVRVAPAEPGARSAVVTALGELGDQLRGEGLASRVVMDDYVPEVGRYGGATNLALAENLFTADSDAVADLVGGNPAEDLRLYQAVADMLHWCSVLFDMPQAQHDFLEACSAGLGLSFPAKGNAHGKLFREHRAALDEHLARAVPDPRTTVALAALTAEVRGAGAGRDRSVLGSALHLHCNRLFAFDANRMEFLGYELARRKVREQRVRAAS